MLNRITELGREVIVTTYKSGKPISFSIDGISSVLPEEMFNIAFPKKKEVNLVETLKHSVQDFPENITFLIEDNFNVWVRKNIVDKDVLETNSLWDFARSLAKSILEKMKEAGHYFAVVTLSSEVIFNAKHGEYPYLSIEISIN